MQFFLRFSLFFFPVSCLLGQVDEVKMRHEVSSYQFKKQSLGEIIQRATIIDTESNRIGFEPTVSTLLQHHTELYSVIHGQSQYSFSYRGRILNPNTIFIDNVALNSPQIGSISNLLEHFDLFSLNKIEVLYGVNPALNLWDQGASIALQHTSSIYPDSSANISIKPYLRYGYHSGIGIQLSANKNDRLVFNSSISRRWTLSPILSQQTLNASLLEQSTADNLIVFRPNTSQQFKLYGNISISSPYQLFQEKFDSFKEPNQIKQRQSPFVFSYLQWNLNSDISKWYSKLSTTLSYQHSQSIDSSLYSFSPLNRSYTQHQIGLQINGFKNLDARKVFSYGIQSNGMQIHQETKQSDSVTLSSTIQRLHFQQFFTAEFRNTSDVSWIIGMGSSLDFLTLPLGLKDERLLMPTIGIHAAWTRHLCENSNYSIRLLINYLSPKLEQVYPLSREAFSVPNPSLKGEKSVQLEGNLYRKCDDKLEWNLSIYGSYSKDAIYLRDYFYDHTDSMVIGGNVYPILKNENIAFSARYGFDNELKYHLSKQLILYQHIHINFFWKDSPHRYISTSNPIYGSIGAKFKSKKIFYHTWIHYNAGLQTSTNPNRYEMGYNDASQGFTSWWTWHGSIAYCPVRAVKISGKVDNILNSYAWSYGSTLPNLGRNFHLQCELYF